MSIQLELSRAIKRWEHTQKQTAYNDQWLHFKTLLLGSDTDIPKVTDILRHTWWKDALCTLLQIDGFGNLRLNSKATAQNQISTVLFMEEISKSATEHLLLKLVKEGYFRRLILQLCTKLKYARVPSNLYEYLYELSIKMATIPEGRYWVGSAQTHSSKPYHMVRVNEYQISSYAVTQLLWQHVMPKNPSKFKGVSRPVEQVSWHDAIRFCNAMSTKHNLEPYYNVKDEIVLRNPYANGYRLPSEAQWEIAARAERSYGRAKDENSMPLSISKYGWISQSTGTRPVGQKEPNPFGLYDILGNVHEWCWDLFAPFSYIIQEKGTTKTYFERIPEFLHGYVEGYYRVLRGGCWNLDSDYALPYRRMANHPHLRSPSIGFRICKPSIS